MSLPDWPLIHVAPQLAGNRSALNLGVPLARGWLSDVGEMQASDANSGEAQGFQARPLSRWPDGSIKWLLADILCSKALSQTGGVVALRRMQSQEQAQAQPQSMAIARDESTLTVDSGAARFVFDLRGSTLLSSLILKRGERALSPDGVRLSLKDANGAPISTLIDTVDIQETGPVRTVVLVQGRFDNSCPLEFSARWSIINGASSALLDLCLRNPQPAQHHGGLWDLGDPGSVLIGDLSVVLAPASGADAIAWQLQPHSEIRQAAASAWSIVQDSSGGEHWNSPNHLAADGRLGVSHKGFRISPQPSGAESQVDGNLRAQPVLAATKDGVGVAASVRDFWQNFPKALRWADGQLSVGLFPGEGGRVTELQGGEQKRHRMAFAFGESEQFLAEVNGLIEPAHAWVDPAWVEASGAVRGFVADLSASPAWGDHVRTIVDGPDSFSDRREVIDEYGWRNFGDLWADHEAVNHTGAEPFVSHYNNQYDFVLGAGFHALRTGDARWARLARETAEHTADIDVYHTRGDRAAFNGGLFWHTDHYLRARTATHRTYSVLNAGASAQGSYGGGPANEHNYASGLLLHHFRTGDEEALEAVIGLSDWVIAMDDGSTTLLGLVDPGPTGLASNTLDTWYHGPGRGAGNSIATLLDGSQASGRRAYLSKAEELIARCIHPADDIDAFDLANIENRWSYLAFLQSLGKYLEVKLELGECDYHFQYARESLLHYADWMLEHEVPYKDVLHKVELPTETWPAHDMRKCHILHLAARFDGRARADLFRARAAFFHDRCLHDLNTFKTRHLTRPLVLLSVFGHLHAYYQKLTPIQDADGRVFRHIHEFGKPVPFVGQRDRFKSTLRARIGVARRELTRILRDRFGRRRSIQAKGRAS